MEFFNFEPLEVKIPITPGPVSSHFFSDYNPLMFSFISGPVCSLLLALLVVVDRERETLSVKSKSI
jgi:hypothetical protein